MSKIKIALTIAGSDSGGGAGVQADLKTFAANGVYGASVITAITAQNTVGVQGVYELPSDLVGQQIDSVMDDIGADAVKIGMLSSAEIINVVADRIRKYKIRLVVLDPVMVAKSGDHLLKDSARASLISQLIPLSFVVTPNIEEAKVLTGLDISSIEQMKQAAVEIYQMGCRYVVVKGGHLGDDKLSTDVLYDGSDYSLFSSKRIKTKNTHGTGCTFASAIAAELAKGNDIYQAVDRAKKYLHKVIVASVDLGIGHGHGPMNHMVVRLKQD
jgi:hydroxymethylpyrimidine/phosphomethylpyrimidine kinase